MSSRIKEDVKKLFEFWCEVARVRDPTSKNAGVIIESFPESFNDQEIISKMPDFAYPCDCESVSAETYSFVLTSEVSKLRFGFCRHDPKTDTAMIIITYLPWHDTFLKLIGLLTTLRRTDNSNFKAFLSETYNGGVPNPGGNLTIFYNGGQNSFIFERPDNNKLPSIPDNHNLSLYYNFATPKNMIAVFASMLAERRIIFTSRNLDKLSSCVQAANAFLYPMIWQHIFIPLLPMKLKDFLSAPMPYLIGVPKAVLDTMTPEELGEVVTLNCDTKKFESPFDDVHEMPYDIIQHLKKHLHHNNSHEHINDRVSRIFLEVLVQLIGGYRDAVEFGDKKTFNRDRFIETRPPNLRPFLAKMLDLQIFQQFIEERLQMLNKGLGFSDEFEMETVRYAEKLKKRGRNYKLFKTVKDKTNPAVKSAVKSMKESSRGMKTVYNDLKLKFSDLPSANKNFQSHVLSTHHSAPSSPIFNKRDGFAYATPDVLSEAATAIRKPLAMSSSNSKIQNGFASLNNNCANSAPVYNNHLDSSPTISPAGSMCSSEMNLSQELQNHPLFKSPMVDRSLKPSSSLDLNYRTNASAARSGAPAPPIVRTLPPHSNHHNHHHHHHHHQYHNHFYTNSSSARQVVPAMSSHHQQIAQAQSPPNPNQPNIERSTITNTYNNTTTHKNNNNNNNITKPKEQQRQSVATAATMPSKYVTTDSTFDSPPDMMSPPVPPRRNNGSGGNGVVTLRRHTSSRSATERNWIGFDSLANGHPPVPAPRLKKEKQRQAYPITHSASHTAVMNDLISLDDSSSTSFDLEDFDPLNQNAKPLPTPSASSLTPAAAAASSASTSTMALKTRFLAPMTHHTSSPAGQSTKSTTLPTSSASSVITGVSNPLYPYFTPQHRSTLPTDMNGSSNARDDDFELLRKYGLDQFSFASEASTSSSGGANRMSAPLSQATTTASAATATTAASMNNWTTFE